MVPTVRSKNFQENKYQTIQTANISIQMKKLEFNRDRSCQFFSKTSLVSRKDTFMGLEGSTDANVNETEIPSQHTQNQQPKDYFWANRMPTYLVLMKSKIFWFLSHF